MNFENLPDIIVGTLTHDALRYAIGAGGVYLVINIALAAHLRSRKIRSRTPNAAQIWREILVSMRTVLIFACTGTVISLAALNNLIPIYDQIATYGLAYFTGSILFIVVAHDAWFYWSHRMMHNPRLFRLLHRTHHRSHNPTPFTSYSFDSGEAVINAIFLPLFVAIVPMHPLALLIFVIHMMLRNALGHCGYEVFPANRHGHPLFGWLTTVTHHDLHHAHAGYNMGLYFTWWDRWMGTEHPNYRAEFARTARRTEGAPVRIAGPLAVALAIGLPAPEARAGELSGLYAAPGLGMVIRLERCAQTPELTCGRLLWGWDMEQFDFADPGDIVLSALEHDGSGWVNGRLVNPETGRVFRGRIEWLSAQQIRLTGCAGPICRNQTWRALQPILNELHALK